MHHIFGHRATQYAVTQGFNDLTAFNDGAHDLTVGRATVVFDDHQVLRYVNQAACQVARVGGFQRRVSQALTCAVGGDEVLQHIQTFAEVRSDRGFNDGAIRLGHQATHTRQLANLGGRTASTRVGHHVDGVERLLLDFVAMAVNGFLFAELIHHHLGHRVTRFAPNVDHLVVTLARSHQTRHILLLNVFDFFFCALDDGVLFLRHQHIVDTDRNTRTCCQTETVLQQLVGKNHSLFQAAFAERSVDELGDFLFLQRLVQVAKRQALGQDFRQQSTTHCGLYQRHRA